MSQTMPLKDGTFALHATDYSLPPRRAKSVVVS